MITIKLIFCLLLLSVSSAYASTISGFIWVDDNEDGFQTPSEFGIPNVRVEYTLVGSKPVQSIRTETDVTGHYQFSDIAAGRYEICVKPRFPDYFFLTTPNAGDGLSFGDALLDSDFVELNHCLPIILEDNQQLDIDMGVLNYTHSDQSRSPVQAFDFDGSSTGLPPYKQQYQQGYIWDDTGPVIRVLDGGDIGLEGLEVVAVDALAQTIISTAYTDENGFYQFDTLGELQILTFLTSLPDKYRLVKPKDTSVAQHAPADHHRRFLAFYGRHVIGDSSYEDPTKFGIPLSNRIRLAALPLIKKTQPESKQAVILLRAGIDRIADGIQDTAGIEPLDHRYSTLFSGSREFILYDEKMRPIMASPYHTGRHFSGDGGDLLFMPVDATKQYTICASPSDDISRYLPSKHKRNPFDKFNDFDPHTGCATLNAENGFTPLLLTKGSLPEKLFGSVWLHEQAENSNWIFTNAPAVEFSLYRAGSSAFVAIARSGIKTLDHGITVTRRTPRDDSNLIYFPDDLQPDQYYLCADTSFRNDGYKISTLSNFDSNTGCTNAFQFPEQRQSHLPSLILERVATPSIPTEPVAGNQVSGLVWLDNNGNGLQDVDEPKFAKTITGLGAPIMSLYPEGKTEFVAVSRLDENSAGQFAFNNVQPGIYYVCMSREYDVLGLSVTSQNAGDDSIDNDFDESPCAYNITVTNSQGADIDLVLVGGPLDEPTDTGNLNQVLIQTDTQKIHHQWRSASDTFSAANLGTCTK